MEEPVQIKGMDSWNQFFKSGKVEDYLQYVSQQSSLQQDTEISYHKAVEHDIHGTQTMLQQDLGGNECCSPNDYDHKGNQMK